MVLMKNMKKILLLATVILLSNTVFGQRNILRYADMEYSLKRFEHAGSQYALAYDKKKSFYAAKRAAQSFTFIKSYQKSYDWWTKVIEFPDAERADYLSYARAAIISGKTLDNLPITLSIQERAAVYGSVEVPENKGIEFRPVDRLNKSGSDYGLTSFKAGEYYFVSDRGVEGSSKKKLIRLDVRKRMSDANNYTMNDRGYHSIFKDAGNGEVTPVPIDLDGVYHLSMPSFFKKNTGNQEVIFTAVLRQKRIKKNKIESFPGLYRAQVDEEGSFTEVSALPFNNLKEFGVMHSLVYKNTLYFSSDMPGGYGGFDLYSAELLEDGYGPAINLGPLVNSGSNEVFPFIHDDELYFSSDRAESLGGLDIYAVKIDLKSGLRNMGVPYNSVQDDFAYFVDASGLKFISSDRGKTESRDDIFSIVYLRDRYNLRVLSEKGEYLNDMKDLQVKLLDANGKEVAIRMNDGNGSELESGDYTVDIRKKGYFPSRIPLKVKTEGGKNKELTYKLIPIPYQRSITIDTIYYNLDKYDIRPDAAMSLDLAVDILNEFPHFNLKITSHTDSRASKAYNERLSKKRSVSASKYLKNKGIDADRMKLDWRGKLELVNPCGDGVKCPEVLHQKNRRSILNLEIYPNSDKDFELPGGLNQLSSTEELMEFFKNKIKSKRDSLLRILNPITISPATSQEQTSQEGPTIQYLADNVMLVSVSGSFYLVYESWTTEAMALKRAKELVKELNTSIYFIPARQKNENYRLAIAKYDSYDEVYKVIRKMRKKYKNEEIWMLDYR